jgi:hypothetical protein
MQVALLLILHTLDALLLLLLLDSAAAVWLGHYIRHQAVSRVAALLSACIACH